jgi:hypothetical protein
VCSTEHYVAFNIPLERPADAPDAYDDISAELIGRHFLSGLLIAEVRHVLYEGGVDCRMHAIQVLRRVMTLHDSDSR